jgi:hypothetical protein
LWVGLASWIRKQQRPYIYIDLWRGPPVRLAWLVAVFNMLGGGKTGYLK